MSAPLYRQMTDLVWISALPDGLAKAKGVLLCYCQHFNDRRGISNPGVPRVARMCGISERTAQKHIRDLERARILLPKHRTGFTTCYSIDISSLEPLFPLTAQTPAESSALPPQVSIPTPAETAPKQSLTAKSTDRTAAPALPVQPYPLFEGVNPETLADFTACRKEKFGNGAKGKVTAKLIAEITAQAALAGMTLQAALEYCCHADRRWASFQADWLKPKAASQANPPAPATPVKVWEPDTTPIPAAPPTPAAAPAAPAQDAERIAQAKAAALARYATSAKAAAPAMPTGASDIRIAADAPPWAARIVASIQAGQHIPRHRLNEACLALKLNPAMLRTGVSVPARASAPVSVSVH